MEEKILNSDIIKQRIGVEPLIEVIEVDKEKQNDQKRTASNYLQVPQSIWMKKIIDRGLARLGTADNQNDRETGDISGVP